ncbi:SGNH/GDSL hydrolase family protein [Penaeicola halotolerans]|uniref:SGNH/GDSL hydrolase family protein n=1 Tax=Penaeicola halotolerans TaxID=2793196 RepID=UPI001CF83B31|nr:SGNH/GDSL hydrolase family protein [Penaeicola halotolerans]
MKSIYLVIFTLFAMSINTKAQDLKFLALGDSYTIGELVEAQDRFPVQLQQMLVKKNIAISAPVIVARTGWTTDELMEGISIRKPEGTYDLVTLLIGVNNQYRGRSLENYAEEFEQLLQTAIKFAAGDASRVFVVSIPDWGITPFAEKKGVNSTDVGMAIDSFNQIKMEICAKYDVSYTDITEHYRLEGDKKNALASDGLHPSGKIYKHWAKSLLPLVEARLK